MKYKRLRINPKKQIGAKSNITIFIFVSFAAIFSLVILGYLKWSDYGSDSKVGVVGEQVKHAQEIVPTPPLHERMKKEVLSALPNGGEGLVHPEPVELYGRWYANVAPTGIAEFTFKTDSYELIYVDTPQSTLRRFSVGKYNYDPATGYLGLFPEYNALPPQQYKGIKYKVITSRNFQMVVLRKLGDPSVYFTSHERDLAGKNYHPIFLYGAYGKTPVLEFKPVVANQK